MEIPNYAPLRIFEMEMSSSPKLNEKHCFLKSCGGLVDNIIPQKPSKSTA